MKLEPARVSMIEWSRKLRSNWTSGAICEPYVAVAIRQAGRAGVDGGRVLVEHIVMTEPLVVVVPIGINCNGGVGTAIAPQLLVWLGPVDPDAKVNHDKTKTKRRMQMTVTAVLLFLLAKLNSFHLASTDFRNSIVTTKSLLG